MEDISERSNPSLSLSKVVRIDQICDRFDYAIHEAIQNGGPWPSVEDYLGDTIEPVRSELRKELLAVEASYRQQQAEGGDPNPPSESLPKTHLWQPGEPESKQTGDDTTSKQPEPVPEASVAHPGRIGRYRIERVLGKGAFGTVYRGYDDTLKRPVAIKVPHRHLVDKPEDMELYLEEAQVVASLDHANIVPVHDVGRTEDGLCYVVSKFIQGSDLARRIKEKPLSHGESAELVAAIAEALQHAHQHMVVHRDVKPANILIDAAGKPYLADFGLALKEEDFGEGSVLAGTWAYMSPEQARYESHLVDGRADIFSLGLVFYELLTASRPFWDSDREKVLDRIKTLEPPPPRQLDHSIPKEMERICLKALSKRASDRYTTALDMAEDLRHFLGQTLDVKPFDAGKAEIQAGPPGHSPVGLDSGKPLKIVPKGLRSFDAQDADFFLELLPGPRDRDGLPESIRFWKYRMEETNSEKTFRVGLIYGPSGCGKSSLVKAGLLPRLAGHAIPVYVEATADDTEARLLRGLRKQCPGLPGNLGLKDSIAALRRGRGIPVARKVLIVLDQFEQWLHAKKEETNTKLVQALRQCDGCRVQCIVMVRDDFWLAVSRFVRDLEVDLVPDSNIALVDLFDLDHARKVLAAFGRAFGKLSEKPDEMSNEQKEFLKQAIAGLAQEGKIVCVRLALFAEMMKGKAWTPASLKEVGGTEGVGATFLEETFSAASAPPEHRYHQKAARGVLKTLLPESGAEIKGHMCSKKELLKESGYAARPADFEVLLRILDQELRLITPTDPEGMGESGTPAEAGEKYYQFTHDYLVHSLRDWLTREEKQTRKGRARLRLAELAAWYHGKPEVRRLPTWWEWLSIRLLTGSRTWTAPQRLMMRQARRYHATRGLILTVCLVLLGGIGWEIRGRNEARSLHERLLDAPTDEVLAAVGEGASYHRWLDPLLRETFVGAEASGNARKQLRAAVALLPTEPDHYIPYLVDRLLSGRLEEVLLLRKALRPHCEEISEQLWATLNDSKKDPGERLRAAVALALYAPEDVRWDAVSGDVAARLISENTFLIGSWAEALRPVGKVLLRPLAGFLTEGNRGATERRILAQVYASYAEGQPDGFAVLEKVLLDVSVPGATPGERLDLIRRQANATVALAAMGRWDRVWPLLHYRQDPTLRTCLIAHLGPNGTDARTLMVHLDREPDVSVQRALLLALGDFDPDRWPPLERDPLTPRLVELYRDDIDPGIHSAAGWLLRHWGKDRQVDEIDRLLQTGKREGQRRWYINCQGQTMTLVPPGEFEMKAGEQRLNVQFVHGFMLSAREVTVAEFRRFRKDHKVELRSAPTPDCPVNLVNWYDAAAYCNWLSREEGIPEKEWCYLPNEEGQYAAGMKVKADALLLSGYRLPTAAEWEYACRAGSVTQWSMGDDGNLLSRYAWLLTNAGMRSHPGGRLRPNDWGLFDMSGNVWEWCHSSCDAQGREVPIGTGEERVDETQYRRICGGCFLDRPEDIGSGRLNWNRPQNASGADGLRPARTLPHKP